MLVSGGVGIRGVFVYGRTVGPRYVCLRLGGCKRGMFVYVGRITGTRYVCLRLKQWM